MQMKSFIILTKEILEKLKTFRYHRIHNTQARIALKQIELQYGKTNPKELKLAKEYAHDIFGWSGYSPWLEVYTAFNQKFKEGWIPDNYYGKVVIPKLQGHYGQISNLGIYSNHLLNTSLFPDIAYFVNGLWFNKQQQVLSKDMLLNFLLKRYEKIVFKKDHTYQGKGVCVLDVDSQIVSKMEYLGNGVCQKFIAQHPVLKELTGGTSVATLRINTCSDANAQISFCGAFLKLGTGKDMFIKSISQIKIPINKTNGKLQKFGHLRSWEAISEHPDSTIKFEGLSVPSFSKAIERCIDMHSKVSYVRIIGWDVTIDVHEEVVVLEWNGYHNDIRYIEATQGPYFNNLGWEKLWREA